MADGFTGNIVLKTSEAIASAIFTWLKSEIYKTPLRKLGGLLARPAFKAIHKKTSADEYGGMPLLGVNGVCIIAHEKSTTVHHQPADGCRGTVDSSPSPDSA